MPSKNPSKRAQPQLARTRPRAQVLRKKRRAPQFQAAHFQLLFETMLEGFVLAEIIVDDAGRPCDWRYLEVNPAFERLVGKSREEVLGRRVREVFPDIDPRWIEIFGRVALSGESARLERHSAEVDRTFDIFAAPQPGGRFTLLFVDVSKRVRAENERLEAERRLQHAQRVESLGLLAGGIAHDFNNLLVGVLGFADLALDSLSAEHPARADVLGIIKSAKRASELSHQMLAYSGKGRFVLEPLDLSELVRRMDELLKVSRSSAVPMRYELAEHLPVIEGDATQIRQVVMNLVRNAAEAVEGEGGEITIRTGTRICDAEYLRELFLGTEIEPAPSSSWRSTTPAAAWTTPPGRGSSSPSSAPSSPAAAWGSRRCRASCAATEGRSRSTAPKAWAPRSRRSSRRLPRPRSRSRRKAWRLRAGEARARSCWWTTTRRCARWPSASCAAWASTCSAPTTASRRWRCSRAAATSWWRCCSI